MRRKGGWWIALAGLGLLFALLVLVANQITLTADEPAYIASGRARWRPAETA